MNKKIENRRSFPEFYLFSLCAFFVEIVCTHALGNPLKIILTAGKVHDITVAHNPIIDFNPAIVMAYGGYDSLKFRKQIEKQGAIACINSRNNRRVKLEFYKEQYKERHLIEWFFQKLKRNRRICRRYEKLADRFLAFIHRACIFG